jgi:hypothetical protein
MVVQGKDSNLEGLPGLLNRNPEPARIHQQGQASNLTIVVQKEETGRCMINDR